MEDAFLLQASGIYFLSLWKTYIGPLIAAGSGFSYLEMLLVNLGAALSSVLGVIALTDLGMKRKKTQPKGFDKNLRKTLRFWKKYGKSGSALLAPVLIGIPTYTLIARRLKASRRSIILEITLITFTWCTIFYWAGVEGLLIAESFS